MYYLTIIIFTIGEEYYQLVNLDGDVLIDESKKITDTESINIRKSGKGLTDKSNRTLIKIKIKYRENAQNVEPKEALLNLETLEIVDLQDVLNTAP